MHTNTWVAYHACDAHERLKVDRAIARIAPYYDGVGQDVGTLSHEHLEHLGCAVWAHDTALARVRLIQHRSSESLTGVLFWPFGVSSLSGLSPDLDVVSLVRELERHPEAIAKLSAPQIAFSLDARARRLFFACDTIGFGRVYCRTEGGVSAWSNRLAPLTLLFDDVPPSSSVGWSAFMTVGWFLGSDTPFAGISVLPPGCRVTATDSSDAPVLSEASDVFGAVIARSISGESMPAEVASEALVSFFREMYTFIDAPIRIGLSGGRDSRIVAAAALRAEVPAELYTRYPPDFDLDLARTLVQRLPGAERRWSFTSRISNADSQRAEAGKISMPPTTDDDEAQAPLLQKAMSFHAMFDGDRAPNGLYAAWGPTNRPMEKVTLSGAAGEFCHPTFYTQGAFEKATSAEQLARQVLGRFPRLLRARPNVMSVAAAAVEQVTTRATRAGVAGIHLLHYFYIFGRFRRWADGNKSIDTLLPLLAQGFALAAASQPVQTRFSSAFQRQVINDMIPEWSDIPFGHEVDSQKTGQKAAVDNHAFFWEAPEWGGLSSILRRDDIWGEYLLVDETRAAYSELDLSNIKERSWTQTMSFRIAWLVAFEHHRERLARFLRNSRQTEKTTPSILN